MFFEIANFYIHQLSKVFYKRIQSPNEDFSKRTLANMITAVQAKPRSS